MGAYHKDRRFRGRDAGAISASLRRSLASLAKPLVRVYLSLLNISHKCVLSFCETLGSTFVGVILNVIIREDGGGAREYVIMKAYIRRRLGHAHSVFSMLLAYTTFSVGDVFCRDGCLALLRMRFRCTALRVV